MCSQQDAENFMAVRRNPNKEIVCQLDDSIKRIVEANRQKLFSILSTILLCGTNDLALRGKEGSKGNMHQLLNFRIEAGDKIIKNHLDTAAKNAICDVYITSKRKRIDQNI